MSNKLAIFGAGGHSKVILDIALRSGYNDIDFFDDNMKITNVKGNLDDLIKLCDDYKNFFVAIGDNYKRKDIYSKINKTKIEGISLIHPSSNISSDVIIGNGVCIMPGVSINANTIISKGTIINTNSSIDHDCIVEEFTHICPGVNIAGSVNIGSLVFVGIGSNIINNISISKSTMIKAGATVTKSI
ncbi:NeuD/PglB/VioB family sugar acetyltransferase [Pelagibacteraceae bacterium]|nr:NeuD/PglB/VioB family sugar acetyltransferase [Pelagibacteraceae bacterium]